MAVQLLLPFFLYVLYVSVAVSDVRRPSKILVMPYGVYSHVNMFTKLGEAASHDGHDVTVMVQDTLKGQAEKRGLKTITYTVKPDDDLMGQITAWTEKNPEGEGIYEQFLGDPFWRMAPSRVCHSVMRDPHITSTIQREKFDLIIMDGLEFHVCFMMIPYKYDIPFIIVHGFLTTSWVAGVTGMPSLEPEVDRGLSNRMDFWERKDNLHSWWERYNNMFYDLYQDHMDKYCPPHKPKIPLMKLGEMAEMYLMNYEIMCLDYPRVSAPNMQYLGGSTTSPPQPLPEDLETYITQAEHGVVLMTLGSMKAAQYLWKIMGPKLFPAFGRLRQRVIVQYRIDTVYGEVPPNVKLMKWIPQNDILGHPNVKLFVMHGGNNGQNEAIYHGVPMLVMPLYSDQLYNGRRVQANGFGNYVPDKKAVTSEELYDMMREILTNQTYSDKTKKCSAIVRSMPTAQEKFVFWVNHILQFGGAHLRPPSLDMPLYQVLMLDILAYYLIRALALFHAAIFILYFLIKYIRNNFKAKKD